MDTIDEAGVLPPFILFYSPLHPRLSLFSYPLNPVHMCTSAPTDGELLIHCFTQRNSILFHTYPSYESPQTSAHIVDPIPKQDTHTSPIVVITNQCSGCGIALCKKRYSAFATSQSGRR